MLQSRSPPSDRPHLFEASAQRGRARDFYWVNPPLDATLLDGISREARKSSQGTLQRGAEEREAQPFPPRDFSAGLVSRPRLNWPAKKTRGRGAFSTNRLQAGNAAKTADGRPLVAVAVRGEARAARIVPPLPFSLLRLMADQGQWRRGEKTPLAREQCKLEWPMGASPSFCVNQKWQLVS